MNLGFQKYVIAALVCTLACGLGLAASCTGGSQGSVTVGHPTPAPVPVESTITTPPQSLQDLLTRGWAVVDDPAASQDAPSRWTAQGGNVLQTSNIYGGSNAFEAPPSRPGTYFVWSGQQLADASIAAVFRSGDDDAFGLILRYQDPSNYVRFEWDRQRWKRRIIRVAGGVSTILVSDSTRYETGTPHRVRFSAFGNRVAVFLDGSLIMTAADPNATPGGAGLFCWGNNDLAVSDIEIVPIQSTTSFATVPPGGRRPDAPMATHGVAAFDPSPDGALLWVRTSEPASVRFELATDPSFRQIRSTQAMAADESTDCTLSIPIVNLDAATRYFYRAVLEDPQDASRRNFSDVGAFSTAPAASAQAPVRFAFSADISQFSPERFTILEHASARAPEFFLSLGDFPYCDATPTARDLPSFREKFRDVRAYPDIVRFMRSTGVFAVWDDHEVTNDWNGATNAALVRVGTHAWKEFFGFRSTQGGGLGIHRSFRWGNALEVFLLDTRSFRSANTATDGPSKTMLGAAQKQWLKDSLSASTATFKAIVTSVPLRYGTTANDHWQGFATERSELFQHILQNQISGVFFLAGDQHWASVHHHPEGFVEVQACPISASLRTPATPLDPHIVFQRKTYSYGLVNVDAAQRTCTIELFDGNDSLMHTEVIR